MSLYCFFSIDMSYWIRLSELSLTDCCFHSYEFLCSQENWDLWLPHSLHSFPDYIPVFIFVHTHSFMHEQGSFHTALTGPAQLLFLHLNGRHVSAETQWLKSLSAMFWTPGEMNEYDIRITCMLHWWWGGQVALWLNTAAQTLHCPGEL